MFLADTFLVIVLPGRSGQQGSHVVALLSLCSYSTNQQYSYLKTTRKVIYTVQSFYSTMFGSVRTDCLISVLCYIGTIFKRNHLRNEFNFWNVHGRMNTSGLLQSGFTLTLQETRSIHDSMNIPKMNLLLIFIFYIIGQISIFNFT